MAEPLAPSVAEAVQGFDIGEIVELFIVDATRQGSEVFAFTPATDENAQGQRAPLSFGGQIFAPFPLESKGWEWSGKGSLPQPQLTLHAGGLPHSASMLLLAALAAHDDLLGATVTRLRVLRENLDGGADPDGEKYLSREIYAIEQKTGQSPTAVTFRLRSAIDQEGVQLPRRVAISRCQFVYRVPDGAGGFSYERATCPYVGPLMFDAAGNVVAAPELDACGKTLSDCKLRFGENAVLPFGGFPGIGRFTS